MTKRHNKKSGNNKNLSDFISYGDFTLPPVVPGLEVIDLCNRIDSFYSSYPKQHKRQKSSDLIKGAFYALRPECRSNPDRMSQAASSARDVLYPLISEGISDNNLIKLFRKYTTNKTNGLRILDKEFIKTFNSLDRIYKQLSDFTHHGTELKSFSKKQFLDFSENDFRNLLKDFILILGKAFDLQQAHIHTIIDLIAQKKRKSKGMKSDIELILNVNFDAYQYFYSKIDKSWLDWLWKNGFLDTLKGKLESPDQYGRRRPELNYLARVSEKAPASVTKIMFEIPVSVDSFNPEVIDRFLRICSELPEKELVKMLPKIYEEKWTRLMNTFNDWGFEYEKMLQTLEKTNNYEGTLILAKILLSVRTKKEAKESSHLSPDNPFYFKDLRYTKIFKYLLKIDEKNIEKVLTLTTNIMNQVVLFGEKEGKDEVFKVYDSYFLLDIDFFELELTEKNRLSYRDDVKNLAAVIKHYTIQIIGQRCDKAELAKKLYDKYFASLPDSRSMWRLKLFVMSLCPEVFKNRLKKAFFQLFDVERYYNELISGTEYLKSLRVGFPVLSKTDKREYIRRVMEYFIKKDQEKENEKEDWHITYGSRILSMIVSELTEDEKKTIQKEGFILNPKYDPVPTVSRTYAGTIVPRGKITKEEFNKLEIGDIAKKLRTDWVPEKLRKQNTSDNFMNPLNAEGVGEQLRADIPNRLQDYITNSNLFFERDGQNILDEHYTYSFLMGIWKTLQEKKMDTGDINWDSLISICIKIKDSGETRSFDSGKRERGSFDAWLSDWRSVHSAMTDVIQELLKEQGGEITIDFSKYRNDLLAIINYLLSYQDPVPKDEKLETAITKTKDPGEEEWIVSDPFSIAINTVRGRAFQALTLFIYQDGKKFPKDKTIKIESKIKEIYESVLENEDTRALMFMFGHYLPSFYYRDKEWIEGLLPKIFPEEIEKKNLYTASWEGYLSTDLYKELFTNSDIRKLYERGITLTKEDFPKQRHFKDPDEGLAIHLALALIYFPEFDLEHNLFKKFWGTKNIKGHKEFISFIGRHAVSKESADVWAKHNSIDIDKFRRFWDWSLKHCNAEELIGFGFWINTEQSIFDIKWLAQHVSQTLKRTGGYLEWDHGLVNSLMKFAKESPEDTLEILRTYLLEEVAKHEPQRGWLHIDSEVLEAFKMLYENPQIKEGVRALINDLLPYRSGLFWGLKSVLDESKLEEPKTK